MARIRTIKPEFWSDEKLGPLDCRTRLVFLGLISHADDAGRLVDSVRQLDGLLFPYSDETCAEALDILARLSRIRRYTSASGQKLIQIERWAEHQRVDKPAKYTLPPPPPQTQAQQHIAESSRDPRDTLATSSRSDLLPTTNDLRPTSEEQTRARDPVFGSLDSMAVRSIKGLYGWEGTEGTDARIWNGETPDDRKRCLSIAVQRYEAERAGQAWNGRFFRAILTAVLAEQHGKPATARKSGYTDPAASVDWAAEARKHGLPDA